ncbi:MAG: hypothetical protein MJB12_09685, partial [Firmicutes bacterium]|nr:hypothetical protein [Bacillota bacterium]
DFRNQRFVDILNRVNKKGGGVFSNYLTLNIHDAKGIFDKEAAIYLHPEGGIQAIEFKERDVNYRECFSYGQDWAEAYYHFLKEVPPLE